MIKRKMLLFYVLSVSLAGFLFGFDTVVISGADRPLQQLWETSDLFHGVFVMSIGVWGTVVGALLGGIPSNRIGRRKTLFWIGILYLLSALGSALATGPYLFSFSRFVGGLGVGASSVTAPIYISEIVPANERGRMVACYQFNIVFGILLAYISNYVIVVYIGANAWRWMFGVEAIPAAIYSFFVLFIPESPRWLILRKSDNEGARKILKQLNPKGKINMLLQNIKASVDKTVHKSNFFSDKYKYPILLAFLIAFFNQFSGINFVLIYAPRIFGQAGLIAGEALGASVPIGIINLLFTLLGMYLIDRVGRKQLMYFGSFGYILSLSGVAWAFLAGAGGVVIVLFITAFIVSHAIGQGAVIWVFISEIFPNSVRDYGMALGSGTLWVCTAIITLLTPIILGSFSAGEIFLFFAGMMVLQLIFVWKIMPETKSRTLEELEKELALE